MRLVNEVYNPQPGRLKLWTGTDGIVWRRIGNEPLDRMAVRRLIEDPAVRVALFDGPEPAYVAAGAREELWHRMEPVLSGKRTDNPFADFISFKYRDDARNVLLAIEEHW
jgi:hypothetical protein